ncbi:DUF502 domain-containing protein [Neptuniibacter halophilus]|uniref:DUF502 domain-containing protein n=1 Tax=Neptuniibacter halophilus TaxID=651666 RepID=UPI002573EF85|nr:DUF502 domain-containing protein [Neptuniibacter halophilus]
MLKSKYRHFFELVLQGFFGILPIVIVAMIAFWLYDKVDIVVNGALSLVGFQPEKNHFLWFSLVLFLLVVMLYFVGHLMETRLASFTERVFAKIPGYSTIKDIIGIFNSSKEGENKVLVVAIRGFASQGYNIGLMYSQTESIIRDHYTVTLSQTPIPNGGYMFEVHKDNIFVIEEASFDHNLQYLLSMGVKSIKDVVGVESREIDAFTSLHTWLEQNNQTKKSLHQQAKYDG